MLPRRKFLNYVTNYREDLNWNCSRLNQRTDTDDKNLQYKSVDIIETSNLIHLKLLRKDV
jgi:hypothetical protein